MTGGFRNCHSLSFQNSAVPRSPANSLTFSGLVETTTKPTKNLSNQTKPQGTGWLGATQKTRKNGIRSAARCSPSAFFGRASRRTSPAYLGPPLRPATGACLPAKSAAWGAPRCPPREPAQQHIYTDIICIHTFHFICTYVCVKVTHTHTRTVMNYMSVSLVYAFYVCTANMGLISSEIPLRRRKEALFFGGSTC